MNNEVPGFIILCWAKKWGDINQSEIINIKYPTNNEIGHPHPFGMRMPPLGG
jgi:hypothetical protein